MLSMLGCTWQILRPSPRISKGEPRHLFQLVEKGIYKMILATSMSLARKPKFHKVHPLSGVG